MKLHQLATVRSVSFSGVCYYIPHIYDIYMLLCTSYIQILVVLQPIQCMPLPHVQISGNFQQYQDDLLPANMFPLSTSSLITASTPSTCTDTNASSATDIHEIGH